MNFKSCIALFTVLVLCFSVVFTKNVDNVRSKRTTGLEKSCDNVKQFFSLKNISVSSSLDHAKGSICSGQCCDDKTESLLRKQGQKDFAALLRHNSRSLQGLLSSTAATLQNHVSELARQSENKTLLLFSQVYRGMAVLSREPIETLYKDIRNYLQINATDAKATNTPEEIVASVTLFFTDLFPLAYHHSADISNKDFTLDYKECLKKSIDTISPFGDVPKQIAQSLSKSLEATRLLLQAFRIGTEVLNTTDTLLIDEHGASNPECHDALVKMTYCPKCLGMTKFTKPCSGYCLNVLRGCIAKYVAELDLPWNGYVEGIESLLSAMRRSNNDAGVNADIVIRNLDTKISAAIMHYMEKGKDIDARVKRSCGTAEFSQKEDPLIAESNSTPAPTASSGKPRSTNPRNFSPLPESELSHFLTSIAKTKGFYANLATTLCQDESFAEPKDQQCWNGERIAEYTKTVVDVGLDMQKYNPEVKPSTNMQSVDPRVADLVDKLRRVHHMAVNSLGPNYSDTDYMQRDGADGSGSGSGPDFEEDDREEDYMRGSGSGDGPSQQETEDENGGRGFFSPDGSKPSTHKSVPTVTIAGSSSSISPSALLSLLLFISTIVISRFN